MDDLGLLLREVDMSTAWYDLGLQLKIKSGTLDRIQADFNVAKHQLREMLKTWLITGDDPNWITLTTALRSRMVGASQLAAVLETKYCLIDGTELDVGGHPKTDLFLPSSVSESIPTVISQHPNMQENMGMWNICAILWQKYVL